MIGQSQLQNTVNATQQLKILPVRIKVRQSLFRNTRSDVNSGVWWERKVYLQTLIIVLAGGVVTYASKHTALAILYSSCRQICEGSGNHSAIIECYVAANSSINNIAAFVIFTNDLRSSTTEGRMGGWIIWMAWSWVQ